MTADIVYCDFDKHVCEWTQNLVRAGEIPYGEVWCRSIKDIKAKEIRGLRQFHVFNGLSGWALALRLAGWPEEISIITGSAPCQSFSAAGKKKGYLDPRDLWPEMSRLIKESSFDVALGEQVAGAIGFGWLDRVFDDLEAEGYACGAAVLPSCSVGAPHIRQRLYWVADRNLRRTAGDPRETEPEVKIEGRRSAGGLADTKHDGGTRGFTVGPGKSDSSKESRTPTESGRRGHISGLGDPSGDLMGRLGGGALGAQAESHRGGEEDGLGDLLFGPAGDAGGLADSQCGGCGGKQEECRGHDIDGPQTGRDESTSGIEHGGDSEAGRWSPWSDFTILPCTDGKSRRTGRGVFPLVAGLPRSLGQLQPQLQGLAELAGLSTSSLKAAKSNRLHRLRGYGNAIVPWLAAHFIRAYMEARGDMDALGGLI